MSTPHIEHFVDERGNFIYRAEFESSFLSKDEAKELGKYVSGVLAENAKLRELVGILFGRLQAAEDVTGMGWIDARLLSRMRELGVVS